MAPWHSLDPVDTYVALASGPERLTSGQARQRLAEVGPDVIQRVRGAGPLRILWHRGFILANDGCPFLPHRPRQRQDPGGTGEQSHQAEAKGSPGTLRGT